MRKRRKIRELAYSTLKNTFGKSEFRAGQLKVVTRLMQGKDTFGIFPTGAGKSICFQIAALNFDGITIVISPLISLMNDQIAHLKQIGIAAECINGLQSSEEKSTILQRISEGNIKLIYVSPERLELPAFSESIHKTAVSMVVVDEAHCVDKWGEDFRKAYSEIGSFISSLDEKPVVCAMTATADKKMQQAIIESLNMENCKIFTLPLLRENLTYTVFPTVNKNKAIEGIISSHPGQKGIVFCQTRKRTEETESYINACNLPIPGVSHYHSRMNREERIETQTLFSQGRYSIICSTSAFGMGVDIPDIRFLIHDALPGDIIDYIQQSGRAGRDGKKAECIVLFDVADLEAMRSQLKRIRLDPNLSKAKRIAESKKAWKKEKRMLKWILSGKCLSSGLLQVFSQSCPPCGTCSSCKAQKINGKFKKFAPVPNLYNMSSVQLNTWVLLRYREYLSSELGISKNQVISAERLTELAKGHIIDESENINSTVMKNMNLMLRHMRKY